MRRSTSKYSTTSETGPEGRVLAGPFGFGLAIDVEEWYHNCWIPEYVDPWSRPPLVDELDRLLPSLAERLAAAGRNATFFVLGEVAERLPHRVRELAASGHEIACHGFHHLRASHYSPAEFRREAERVRRLLEDLTGGPIAGFRTPEWSLRGPENPRLRVLADLGFRYDSSLAPSWGAGSRQNPRLPTLYFWGPDVQLLELPPATWAGRFRLPVSGWTGRLAPIGRLRAAAEALQREGGLPVLTAHPWELLDRPIPGVLTGFARFFHDAGRRGYSERFGRLLAALPWSSLQVALEAGKASGAASAESPLAGDDTATLVGIGALG